MTWPLVKGMRMRAVFLLAGLLAATGAHCQTLDDGTVDVYFQQISRQGELEGCSLVFTALTADHAYLRGKQIVMNGSLALRTLGGSELVFAGKLGTRQMLGEDPGRWEAPNYFYFATRNGTTAGHAKISESDTTGYRLLLGNAAEDSIFNVIKEMGETGEFLVGFNRKEGGQDVYSSIKINVALKRDAAGRAARVLNADTRRDFFDCVSRVAAAIEKRIRK